jgi:DedD protein
VDTQAKERLTGAVILVALLVLLVPELLTGPGPQVVQVAASPTEEPPLRSYTVELGDDARSAHHAPDATSAGVAATPPAPASPAAAVPAPAVAEAQAPPAVKNPAPAALVSRPQPQAAPEPPPVTGWMVQLGSFSGRINAERLVRELKAQGFAASVTESVSGGHKLYRVRVGPVADRATVQAVAAKLRAAGHPGSLTPSP